MLFQSKVFAILFVVVLVLFSVACDAEKQEAGDQLPRDAGPRHNAEADQIAEPEPEPESEVLRLTLPSEVKADGIELGWAAWGGKGGWVDATQAISKQLQSSGVITCRGPALIRAVGDPGVKYANTLVMLFDTPGGPVKVCLHNLAQLRLTMPGDWLMPPGESSDNDDIKRLNQFFVDQSDAGNKIVWSKWGRLNFGNRWVDAYPLSMEQLHTNGRVQNSRRGFTLSHPVTDRDKELHVLLSLGGQPMRLHMVGGAWFELDPEGGALISPADTSAE